MIEQRWDCVQSVFRHTQGDTSTPQFFVVCMKRTNRAAIELSTLGTLSGSDTRSCGSIFSLYSEICTGHMSNSGLRSSVTHVKSSGVFLFQLLTPEPGEADCNVQKQIFLSRDCLKACMFQEVYLDVVVTAHRIQRAAFVFIYFLFRCEGRKSTNLHSWFIKTHFNVYLKLKESLSTWKCALHKV